MTKKISRGIYPGTFDPVTYGHIDLIKRALRIFDEVIVAVAHQSSGKDALFSVQERMELLRRALKGVKNVRVDEFDGLVVNYAEKKSAVMIRGVRMLTDFEYEFQMALTNRKLSSHVETIFLMPDERFAYLSSRQVKEVARLKGDIRPFVPAFIEDAIRKKYENLA
jgi:pantetheine-phosphate adenylyltransferase